MTQEQMDVLSEAYLSAVWHLVTGRGGLRARLREALTELEKCRMVCDVFPSDEFEFTLIEQLPKILAISGRLEEMNRNELQELAWTVWRVQGDIAVAIREHVAEGR